MNTIATKFSHNIIPILASFFSYSKTSLFFEPKSTRPIFLSEMKNFTPKKLRPLKNSKHPLFASTNKIIKEWVFAFIFLFLFTFNAFAQDPGQDNINGRWLDEYGDITGIIPNLQTNTTVNGGLVKPTDCGLPADYVTLPIQPSGHSAWSELTVDGIVSPSTVTIEVYPSGTNTNPQTIPLPAPLATGSTFPLDLSAIDPDVYPSIELRVLMDGTAPGAICPAISEIQVTWVPEAAFAAKKSGPSQVSEGSKISYSLQVSVGNANGENVVVWDQLSRQADGTVILGQDVGQNEDPTFESAILGGMYTASAIVVNGVNVPENSAYWDLGTLSAGASLALKYTVRSKNDAVNNKKSP